MIGFIALGNFIFLFLRSLSRGPIELNIVEEEKTRMKQDYLGCEETELLLSGFSTTVCFIGTNLMLLYASLILESSSGASQRIVKEQLYL